MSENLIQRAAADLAGADFVIVLTGAGISVESGIPPFRGRGGVWEKIDPMEYATIEAFVRDPAKVWNGLIKEMNAVVSRAMPNAAHLGLARMEQLGIVKTVITQNVDGLHQKAGNTDVIEFHGNFARQRCMDCRRRTPTSQVSLEQIPPRCSCGGILRPECIFFGEMIPPQHLARSQALAARCDAILVIGTSAVVQPAAYIPVLAKQNGARVIEINAEPTPLSEQISDYRIDGRAGDVILSIVTALEGRIADKP